MAYGATEPEAGSDLAALRTTATPGRARTAASSATGSNGRKQWISNGGVADLATVLALAPGRAELVRRRAGGRGLRHEQPEDKHGIRAQQHRGAGPRRRARRCRPARRRRRGPGPRAGAAGLRLHAPDGRRLRPRRAAGPRSTARSRTRPSASRPARPLSEKQGYTHKLIVPHAVRLEAARAYIEETACRARRRRARVTQHRGGDRQVPRHRGGQRAPPTPASRRSAATATRASTWSRRSSATCASPRSTRAPRRSWR